VSNTNVGDAKINGYELNFRQELTFLPPWARGIQIFANMTHLRVKGSNFADFDTFIPRSYNWGASLNRKRYTVSLNWHARGRQRNEMVTGALTPADTFAYTAPQTTLDLNFEVRVSSRLSLYGVMRNVTDVERVEETYAPQTPQYARLRTLGDRPTTIILGMKGQF
jgi:iron complex outermembrane recepter protein